MNSDHTPVDLYESARDDLLPEIIRQAEARLNEQGQVNRSVDQKAVQLTVLFGTLAAASLPVSAQALHDQSFALMAGALAAGVICFICAVISVIASIPTTFGVVGNDPGNWQEDLAEGKSKQRCLAESAQHYDVALKRNRVRMQSRRVLLIAALFLFCSAAPAALIASLVVGAR